MKSQNRCTKLCIQACHEVHAIVPRISCLSFEIQIPCSAISFATTFRAIYVRSVVRVTPGKLTSSAVVCVEFIVCRCIHYLLLCSLDYLNENLRNSEVLPYFERRSLSSSLKIFGSLSPLIARFTVKRADSSFLRIVVLFLSFRS